MSEHSYTQEQIDWARSLIMPEIPELDEKDHELAMYRFVMNQMMKDVINVLFDMNERRGEKRLTLEQAEERLHDVLFTKEGYVAMPDGTDENFIHEYANEHNWSAYRGEVENGYHCGDCTSVPATCTRCLADCFYDNPYPFTTKDQNHGWEALNILNDTGNLPEEIDDENGT